MLAGDFEVGGSLPALYPRPRVLPNALDRRNRYSRHLFLDQSFAGRAYVARASIGFVRKEASLEGDASAPRLWLASVWGLVRGFFAP